ncbi:hypothetical protein ACMFMG_005937 [Clarireedia jacksonii]
MIHTTGLDLILIHSIKTQSILRPYESAGVNGTKDRQLHENPPTSCLLHHTSYLIPPTSYLLPHTSCLLPSASCLLPHTSYPILSSDSAQVTDFFPPSTR